MHKDLSKDNLHSPNIFGDEEYRRMFELYGFKKPDNECLTKQELQYIFIKMQEELGDAY